MPEQDRFARVWDALEDDPVRVQNLKPRAALMIEIAERIKDEGLTQTQAAEVLNITPPRGQCPAEGEDQRLPARQPGGYGASIGTPCLDQRSGIGIT